MDLAVSSPPLSESSRLDLLERHGSFALAYSVAFQPGLSHFGDSRGFLSYRMVGGTAFVLADPLADPADRGTLIDSFIAEKGDVTFWQVSREMAELLDSRGFAVNALGVESIVDLPAFGFGGPRRRSFRTAANRMARNGHKVVERPPEEFDAAEIAAISQSWRRTRTTGRHEMGFLVRPAVLRHEAGVRKFFLVDRDERPLGFAFFDPIHENGRLIGYLSATRRWPPGGDPLTAYALVGHALETFKREGLSEFHLGLIPFHRIKDDEFDRDWLTRRAFRLVYENPLLNRMIYPAKSLARHKESYDGRLRQTYCAQKPGFSLLRLLKLIRACRV